MMDGAIFNWHTIIIINARKGGILSLGEERERIFTRFWELGDKAVQDPYLHGLIRVRKVARWHPHKGDSTPREATFVYVVNDYIVQ